MNIKWIITIIFAFGLLTLFYILEWPVVLKTLLIISCFVLIAVVLLQSGRGGGLAAIGGLADQTPFGTRTGGFLSNLTFLMGAIFIFTTVLLTKHTLSSMHGTGTFGKSDPISLQEAAYDDHAGHDHSQETQGAMPEESGPAGMKAVDTTKDKDTVDESGTGK